MNDTIIVALIAFSGTLVSPLFLNKLYGYRLDAIEKKLDNYYQLTERVALIENENRSQWKRIDEHTLVLKKGGMTSE